MDWLSDNLATILALLLGISEALAVIFPPESGVGGILQGIIKFIKKLTNKEPHV